MTAAAEALQALHAVQRQGWTVMEVCGGQTHSIVRWGLDQLLPNTLELIHGPGCPVCVTPARRIDQAIALAHRPEVILCSYGDMLRVPGSGTDLLQARAAGADVRVVTAPLQALQLAQRHPKRQVVLLAVGFETTAPATAVLVEQTCRLGLDNLSLLLAHVRVVPAMERLLTAPDNRVQAFLAAGHVAAVMGGDELAQLVARHRVPVVISGFSPTELLQALHRCVQLLEAGTPALVNAYPAVVKPAGNPRARQLIARVFEVADGPWRGFGCIDGGLLQLRNTYRHLDASRRFALPRALGSGGTDDAHCARVMQGRLRPSGCPSFATACTPQHPLGAPMVSGEGACAAYYAYRQ